MSPAKKYISRLVQEEDGQGMVEYGLILALIAVILFASVKILGEHLAVVFDTVNVAFE